MTPQKRGLVAPEHLERIEAARQALADAEAHLKRVTVAALVDGGSYAELTAATGFSTSTLQRWVRELGVTPAGRKRRLAQAEHREQMDAAMAAMERVLADGWDGQTPLAQWFANRTNPEPADQDSYRSREHIEESSTTSICVLLSPTWLRVGPAADTA